MRISMRFACGIGGTLAVASVLAMVAPKAAHAVAAVLVQVANTSSNPVPNQDVERNARIPYQSHQTVTCFAPNCQFTFTQAPAGYRLVVEHISGVFDLDPSATSAPMVILQDNSLNTHLGFAGSMGGNLSGNVEAMVDANVRAYFDPSDGAVVAYVKATFNAASFGFMTLTGYLENCAVTGCPAIQR